MSTFHAFLFGVMVAGFLQWVTRGRGELEYCDEVRLRQELQYQLARKGMTWEMARWFSEKAPRAWL